MLELAKLAYALLLVPGYSFSPAGPWTVVASQTQRQLTLAMPGAMGKEVSTSGPTIRDLEQMPKEALRAALSERGLSPDGNQAACVIRLAKAMGLMPVEGVNNVQEVAEEQQQQTHEDHHRHRPVDADEMHRRRTPRGFSVIPESTARELRLPPDAQDVEDKTYRDLLYRRHMKFPTKDAEEVDMYVVSSRSALQPWEGVHRDRAETHAVVLLSDVKGWEDRATRDVADEIAFVCNSVVVVPDLFRGDAWDGQGESSGKQYEDWRARHEESRVWDDIRACCAHSRVEFKPQALGLVGFCFGGGRALEEAASGQCDPDAVVAFYPTRYQVARVGAQLACPAALVFAERDDIPGATPADAEELAHALEGNDSVRDYMIRVFQGEQHGFVHRGDSAGKAEGAKAHSQDAMLLATAWLDLYLQKAFQTVGPQVKTGQAFQKL